MKIRSVFALCVAMLVSSFTFAADLVAKFDSLVSGAKSGAFTVGDNGRTITSDGSWLVADGVTVIVEYSGLSLTGTQAIVTLAQSNDSSKLSKVGICSSGGVLKGVWENNAWTGGENTGYELSERGRLVFVYYPDANTRGVFVYDGEGTEIFRAKGLKSTGNTVTTGSRFDIGATAADGLSQEGFMVNSVRIYRGFVAAADVPSLVSFTSDDITLPNGTYTVSQVISGSGAVTVDAGSNGIITLSAANTFTGGLTVKSGTLKTTNATGYGPNNWQNVANLATIVVEEGATLDLGNTKDSCYSITSTGTLTNSGAAIGSGSRQTMYLTLNGNTTVNGNQFGLLGPGYTATTLDLGDHMLTVNMASATTTFILCNCTVSGTGKIRLEQGKLYLKKAITGTLNIDLPAVPEDGATLLSLDSDRSLTKMTLNVTVDGKALPENVKVSAEGVVTVLPESSPIVRDDAAKTWTLDTTEAAYTLESSEINELKDRSQAWTVTLKSASEFGATIDFGTASGAQGSRYIVESGSHTMKWKNDSSSINFHLDGTDENPSILVKKDATLNLYSKDMTGWSTDAKNVKTSVIKVEEGGTLNLYRNGDNTFFFQGRLYLEPGATVEAKDFSANKVCLNGGIYSDWQELYVPSATEKANTVVYKSNVGFKLAKDSTTGYGIFVGTGSTLTLDGALTSDGARNLGKFGEGALEITGSLSGFSGEIKLAAGSIKVKSTSGLAEGKVVQFEEDDEKEIKVETEGEWVIYTNEPKIVFNPDTDTVATTPVLRFSEIMPKPSDKPNSITTEAGYDKNGLESGWVELENTSETEWADLKDYKFIRTNRSKANDKGDYGAFPSVMIPPSSKYVFYTSERYSNSASKADSAFSEGTFDGKPMYFEKYDMMIWGDKINPKKFPFVRLYFKDTTIVDTVVIPSDIPEGNSIIVTPVEEGKATVRYMTNKPTKGAANTALDDASIIKLGPNAGPLYEISSGKKHSSASEFARVAAPAKAGEDYVITFSMNPTMSPTEMAKFRSEDAITKIDMIVRTDLDDKTKTTIPVDLATKTTDAKDWGDTYTATIPSTLFPDAGHLIQWKFKVTDAAGKTWTTPSFHNPDDGYEWYGTIVEAEDLTSKTLPTWHMFVDAASKEQMDIDTDKQNLSVVPHNARVAIYDSSTSNYYDYVRIDLRGNTSANFKKKSHGLRFAKAHPLTMWDPVAGEMCEEVRKSSLIGEPADPSRMRQMMAFWLWNKMGNKVPFDFPVRCNLNGEFFQLGFHSERFTDELIEDFHKLDKYGYGYKNVGTLASGSGTTAGGIEKKTPDDGNESDITVLQNELRAPLKSRGIDTLNASNNEELPEVTKFVVEKFDLPAWLNYLASARITQEMDDVWANISIYYDDAQMLEGTRGTGTWMPLGYDFNLTFGQWYINDVQGATRNGMYMVNQDWFKSHPFYGGNVVRCYKQEAMTSMCNEGNRAIEAVWQSPKFRRLYLRRLRTLMDQELGAPNEDETLENTTIPVMVKMKEVADLMRADANKDTTTYPWDSTISNIDIWGSSLFPKTMDDGIAEIWEKYIVPRRQHLYVTHAAEGHDADKIGYGTTLCAGIPSGQSPIGELKGGISAEYDATIGATIIKNTNDEVIDLSDWMLGGPVSMTLPAGTVIDAGTAEAPAEVYITANRRATIAQMTLVDQVVVGNGTAGTADLAITLSAADGTEVISAPTDQSLYVRLWGFTGAPKLADEDWGEAIVLTNLNQSAAIDLGGMDINFCGSDKLDTASKCHFVLVEGVTIPAGGFIRIKKTDTTLFTVATAWDKIANHGQRITIKDKNGTIVQFFELVDQDALGVYLTGLGLKYDYETSAWETISEQESPGWEDLTPPPPPPEEGEGDEETYPEDATEYTGEYPDTVTIPGGNVLFNGATFAAGLTIAADTTIYLKAGTENSASTITSSGAMTIDGSGTLTINYADGEIGTAAVTFTTELPCYYIQNKGTVNLNLSSVNQVFGFYAKDLKNVVARFNGGVFNATIQGGDSSAAFKFNKGSNDLIINGTEINIALGGTAPRFANVGGHIEFTKDCGKVNVSTITGEGTNARVFKSDKKVKIYGGVILGEASGEGSEIFSAGAEVNVTGGVVNVTAADDCFSAATLISVAGGIIHAVSEAGDALDSNGSMSITGGHVFAFTKSSEHEALDVTPSNLEGDTLEHTLTIDAGATVVAVSGKMPEVEPTGTAAKLMTDSEIEETDQKFVMFEVSKTALELMQKTNLTYAVNWNGKHADTFSVLIAAEELSDSYRKGKNPGKNETNGYKYLIDGFDKILVKTVSVEDLTPPGPEYPEGALVITEPGDYTELIEGDKTVVVDVGAGNTVTFTQANSFTGGLYVYSGTAAQTYRSTNNSRFGGFGANNFDDLETMCRIYVKEGATLDLANTVDASYIVHSAGTIVNSGLAMGVGSRQMTQLILEGDTTIKGSTFGIVRSGHDAATLDLGGHTLTLDMASETTQFVTSALTIKNPGTIKINNGQFFIKADKDFAVENGAKVALNVSAFELNTVVVTGKVAALGSFVLAEGQAGWSLDTSSGSLTAVYVEPTPVLAEENESAEEVGLMISEIMPKASVWDENHCDSGWLEVVNVSQKNVNFGDYTIARFNRGKAVEKLNKWVNNVKEKILAPGERLVIKTSEDYSHADDKTITQYEDLGNVIVFAAKVNPKKYPMVVLVKGGKVVQRCVVPVDVPEDKSVCFDGEDLNGAKVSRICTATMGTRNALRSGIPVGPQISSLYGVADAEDYWTAFDKATVGTDYTVSVPVNPIVGGNEKNEIAAVNLIYQIGWGEIVTNEVAMVKAETEDPLKGAVYSGAIPGAAIQGEGQLVRWAVKITDKAGNAWRSPSFNNPEDGFEWYGTITTPSAEQIEGGITTFHLFISEDIADGCGTIKTKSNCLMNIDADDAAYTSNSKYPYGVYVGIYDNDTGMYYDKVRIDKRGNTSGSFTKKAHGLKFAKAQSFKGIDSVTGKEIECRKSSFTAEYADPSFVRQGLSFKTLNDNGSKAPFHYPVRLNLNGEFYQLAFHTERFSDELIEDFYGLDGKGYGYKNIGPFNPSVRPVSGGIEKKTPDDGVTSDGDILNEFCAKMADCERISEDHTKGDPTPTADSEFETEFSKELTKVVATDFDLPAWLNYIALTKITGETDDVWANLSGYYDVNGTGTWMPLAYDMNQSFGQWHLSDDWDYDFGDKCPATDDHHKAHPLYGGLHIMVHYSGGAPYSSSNNKTSATKPYKGNRCFESIFQNAKYRRLYLRRLRTLMDAEFGGSTADQEHTPIYQRAKVMVERFSAVAAMDRKIWTDYQTQSASAGLWVFGYKSEGWTAEEGLDWMWTEYIQPRRQHLYVTHAAANATEEFPVGYGETKCAGIPAAQSATLSLRDKITAEYVADKNAVVIRNANAETIDLSNWKLEGPVNMTLPSGTVIDQAINGVAGELFVSFDRKSTVAAFGEDLHDQIIVGNGTAGKESAAIALTAADETKVIFTPTPEYNYLRLHSFDGCTAVVDGDDDEWFALTNISDSVSLNLEGVRVQFLKTGDLVAKMDVTLTAGTVEPNGSVKFIKSDFDSTVWDKITNNEISMTIWDSNCSVVQTASLKQKSFANYYGTLGNKTGDKIGGAYYLEAKSFEETLAQADFKEVAYPVTTKTWDEATEITDETPMGELLPEAQATTLVNLGVKPTTLAAWAKSHHATDTLGTEINLEAFALNCAPTKESIDAAKKNFKVTITFNENGEPVAEIESGFYNVTPVLKGRVELPEENWIEVTKDNKDTLRFFRAFIEIGE